MLDIRFALRTLSILLCSMVLVACSSGGAQVESSLASTERRLQELTTAIDAGTLRNAAIIKQYTSVLQSSRPELRQLLTTLATEAELKNPLYQSLQSRYSAVKNETEKFDSWTEKVQELELIQVAANTSSYNDALSDTVNVLADLSNGTLARVNATAKETELTMNKAKDYGAGSQYMGNPHYGYWSGGSGGSLWAWYGQYAFFSSLMGNNRYSYNDWSGRRGYSYYHDVGRTSYSSRSQKASQFQVDQRAKKTFGSSGSYKSPYAKSRSGASGLSKASSAQQKSSFTSQYARNSGSQGKYQSSTRNSSYRTSKGTSRGK